MKFISYLLPSLSGIIVATNAFSISRNTNTQHHRSTSLQPLRMGYGRSSPQSRDRSKRQERVGQIVRTEIASIVQQGYQVKNSKGSIDDELRRRISIVNADVSPDLRQARITVSVIKPTRRAAVEEEEEDDLEDDFDEEFEEPKHVFPSSRNGDAVVDRRRAYSWLVKNTKQVRHALSQRLSHMKTIPNLTFVQADVGAAVDVMNLIEKVSAGDYKRENLGLFGGADDNLPDNMYLESELEGEGWIDDDFDDFDDFEDEADENEDNNEDEDENEEPVNEKK
jgi:ribosome-binding factor A